jgi:hypothetical protein
MPHECLCALLPLSLAASTPTYRHRGDMGCTHRSLDTASVLLTTELRFGSRREKRLVARGISFQKQDVCVYMYRGSRVAVYARTRRYAESLSGEFAMYTDGRTTKPSSRVSRYPPSNLLLHARDLVSNADSALDRLPCARTLLYSGPPLDQAPAFVPRPPKRKCLAPSHISRLERGFARNNNNDSTNNTIHSSNGVHAVLSSHEGIGS